MFHVEHSRKKCVRGWAGKCSTWNNLAPHKKMFHVEHCREKKLRADIGAAKTVPRGTIDKKEVPRGTNPAQESVPRGTRSECSTWNMLFYSLKLFILGCARQAKKV
jgi:hypothetical protein